MPFDPYIAIASLIGLSTAGAFVAVGRNDHGGHEMISLPAPPPDDSSSSASFGLGPRPSDPHTAAIVHTNPPHALSPAAQISITARARHEVEIGTKYDASYYPTLSYPGGDVPPDRGACTDMVIRAFRAANIDFQELVHEDLKENLDLYASVGVEEPNSNVDHRRTGPLYLYLQRNTTTLPNIKHSSLSSWGFAPLRADANKFASTAPPIARRASRAEVSAEQVRELFKAGDIVFFNYKTKCLRDEAAYAKSKAKYICIPDHVALVSDRIGPRGLPMVLQNGGPAPVESDSLDGGTMVGHFRLHD